MMNIKCPHCSLAQGLSGSRIVKAGKFKRKSDQVCLQRYFCRHCRKHFSEASFSPCYNQKKRHFNSSIFHFLASGGTLRRTAKTLNLNRKTVARKLIFLGLMADQVLTEHQSRLQVREFEFDDLETFEHSKLKPLSVTIAVESKTRRILGFRVAEMPAKGLLVKRSLKKYGKRRDERKYARSSLFRELKRFTTPGCHIKSDQNPHYIKDIKKYFPQSLHTTFKGRRGCVVGQGELKAGGFDPLFSLNHTYAMFRANVSRLFRRTWNTTKCRHRLALHLSLYSFYHNFYLIEDRLIHPNADGG